jgi:hypothetical protein
MLTSDSRQSRYGLTPTATPQGELPAPMVLITVSDSVSMTETSLLGPLAL